MFRLPRLAPRLAPTLALVLASGVTAAHGATFTERSGFEAAVSGGYVEGFESLPRNIIGFDGPAVLPTGLVVSSESNELFVAAPGQSTNPTLAIGSNEPLEDVLYFALGGLFTGFGADIFQNLGSGSQADRPIQYLLAVYRDGRVVDTTAARIGPDGGGFLGLTSFDPFDAASLFSSEVDAYEVVDDVTVGDLTVAPIPLPAGLPLLAGALAALGLAGRRPSLRPPARSSRGRR